MGNRANSWQVANDAKHMAEKMNTRRRLESLEFSRIPKAKWWNEKQRLF